MAICAQEYVAIGAKEDVAIGALEEVAICAQEEVAICAKEECLVSELFQKHLLRHRCPGGCGHMCPRRRVIGAQE